MGAINVKHTGSGADIALSSDGTSLLLDGTAIGGGGGDPDLYRDNASSATTPSATGTNAVAIGNNSVSSGTDSMAIGMSTVAASTRAVVLGGSSQAYGINSVTLGFAATVQSGGTDSSALGTRSQIGSNATGATAIAKSYASGADSFAAAITNNGSSYGATGANGVAIGQLAKAGSAGQSVAIGGSCIASGTSSIAISGYFASATGSGSLAIGQYAAASGINSISIGYRSKANTQGKIALSAGATSGIGSGAGHQQRGIYILKGATTDATQKVLTGLGNTADASNSWVLENNASHAFSGTVIARQDGTDGDDYAAWEVKGAVMRADTAATTVVGVAIVNSLYHTAGAAAWVVDITANTTLGSAEVKVTGAAATNVDWVTTIDTSEVVNA
tara:strand:+ start:306 stop:1472 length:1167 start_codon:yes stop_codon:yes gene_type:complete